MDDREKMAAGEMPMDWGFAESMAYASLLHDGYTDALTGQDSRPRHFLSPPCRAARPGGRSHYFR